jgi:predicted dithiol-disulfide oxidoreductase (DUF899 family)
MNSKEKPMPTHKTGTREEWKNARIDLLKAEKELTHQSDALAKQRQALPWVPIDKPYRFDTEKGPATLAELFRGRSQLLMYHFMFGPDYTAGCPACSSIADGFNGTHLHLENHDVMFWAVSRAPLPKLTAYRARMGWSFPWASSGNTDFNHDFNVYFTEEEQRTGDVEYNYQKAGHSSKKDIQERAEPPEGAKIAATTGTDWATYTREAPGMSAFALEDGVVYHTYSAFARGVDGLWAMYQWLDRAPRGRNESDFWIRRHDEYGKS